MEEKLNQLENKVNQIEGMIMQVNEAGVRTDLRLSAYVSFLVKRNAFTLDELESVKGIVDSEITKMKQSVQQSKDDKQ